MIDSTLNSYAGLPTIYLDHNILDYLLKHQSSKLTDYFRDKLQVVYSNETLKEVERSHGYEEKFLSLSTKLPVSIRVGAKLVLFQ